MDQEALTGFEKMILTNSIKILLSVALLIHAGYILQKIIKRFGI